MSDFAEAGFQRCAANGSGRDSIHRDAVCGYGLCERG
jgi:hypothetical protein